jgi:membrane fusion protein (multidrug efflux system)
LPRRTIFGVAVLALASCGKQPATPPPPPQVGVITAQPENVPLTKNLVGRLSAFRSADVRARVQGVLLKRSYVEGSEVKEGQLLFQIDPAPYQAALAQTQGQLARDAATLVNARTDLARYQALAQLNAISNQQLVTQAATVKSDEGIVVADQANVQAARINLGYADVRSPIAGRASQQQVTEGGLVGNGTDTLLTTVDQLDPLYVNFSMGVSELNQMQRAQGSGDVSLSNPGNASVQISLPDGTAYAKQGTVDFSAAAVDSATGAVNLRALIPNPGFVLLPGMYVTLKAELGEQHNVFLIPQPAVQRDTVGAYVFGVDRSGKVVRIDVATNDMNGANWIVTSGLKAGDRVIVSGVQNAKEGAPVAATPWRPQPAGSPTKPPSTTASHGK